MRGWTPACLAAALAAGCAGASPAGPASGGGDASVLEGRTVSAVDGAATPGVSILVGPTNVTADASGYFRVDVGRPSTHSLLVSGPNVVQRETTITGPGSEPARITLIPSAFDLDAFGQMFRPSGALQRWTTRPALVVLGTVMTYRETPDDQYSAASEQLTDADIATLVAHLSEGLSTLTAGTYTSFASVEVERPAPTMRTSVHRPGRIVVGRYEGILDLTNTIGYGQWALTGDGAVGAGAIFLDSEFDRNDDRRRLLRVHELGHALGMMHVMTRASIMNPALGLDATDFDRGAASIAFQRPVGNRAPDVDPSGIPAQRASLGGLSWSDRIR